MASIDYSSAPVAVRHDLAAAHQRLLDHLTGPGTWWTGAERRAIAASARAMWKDDLAIERKAAVSPFAVQGVPDDPYGLSTPVVDTIHRIVNDPGRLTRSWYEGLIADSTLDHERYVELLAVAVFVTSLDLFARAVGVEPLPLPAATEGEPTQRRPPGAADGEAWLPRLATGPGDDPDWTALYGDRDDVAEVERALSLVPDEMAELSAFALVHYMAFRHVGDARYTAPGRAIDRTQTELVAARVSAINECFY